MKKIFLPFFTGIILFFHTMQVFGAKAVGSIPGQFNVSAAGAATYEIPIDCPTGVGGLKPELKFVYSSQLGDG
ncbi:MAG: hypothetical protein J6P34_00610, partial [Paludibacteraceae bacterium]|nr:hypothetical protein [Paludibacteraceae bacterium]